MIKKLKLLDILKICSLIHAQQQLNPNSGLAGLFLIGLLGVSYIGYKYLYNIKNDKKTKTIRYLKILFFN